jgi:hypothetical protein
MPIAACLGAAQPGTVHSPVVNPFAGDYCLFVCLRGGTMQSPLSSLQQKTSLTSSRWSSSRCRDTAPVRSHIDRPQALHCRAVDRQATGSLFGAPSHTTYLEHSTPSRR